MKCKLTVCNYVLEDLSHWTAYQEKIHQLVKNVKKNNTDILLLPEYAGMELAAWMPIPLAEQFKQIQNYLESYLSLYQRLAKEYQIYIQSGSIPVDDNGSYKNRAYFFDTNGNISYQDKMILTSVEKSLKCMSPGTELKLFDSCFGKIGIVICYDSEFPSLSHQLVTQGAKLILVPSCTETEFGYTRVSISCRARAIENQCYVGNAYLVGKLTHCDFFSEHTGYAGIYTPADLGFSSNGILAKASSNNGEFITAELNFDKIDFVREQGQTTNLKDMSLLLPLISSIH